MAVTVTFDTDNDGFLEAADYTDAVVHQLRNIADSISNGQLSGAVRDDNGDAIGRYDALTESKDELRRALDLAWTQKIVAARHKQGGTS